MVYMCVDNFKEASKFPLIAEIIAGIQFRYQFPDKMIQKYFMAQLQLTFAPALTDCQLTHLHTIEILSQDIGQHRHLKYVEI